MVPRRRGIAVLVALALAVEVFVATAYGNAADDKEDLPPLWCITSWDTTTPNPLPESWVNDGYCDCLDTGADEDKTDACSGVSSWGIRYPASRRPHQATR
jgi:hypothetical protein